VRDQTPRIDRGSRELLDSLAHPGAAFLQRLLEGDATEAQLLAGLDATSQPTGNRRLARLQELGLVEREPGRRQAPNRRWRLVAPELTEAVIDAAADLAAELARRDQVARQAARRARVKGRGRRRGIRAVDDIA